MTPDSANPSLRAQPGTLYVVATPLGNLADLSARARGILASVDAIACEDTRSSRPLLDHLGVEKPLLAYHDHNERDAAPRFADELAAGRSLAVISDAGTPALSDPGFRLVRECRRRGLPVVPVPGPCAAIAALCASGLPTDAFLFVGFLPPRTAARTRFLEEHRAFPHTLVLYESMHRIEAFAGEIVAGLGPERVICVAKEITKLHEQFLTGPAGAVAARLRQVKLKGEFVVAIAPADFVL